MDCKKYWSQRKNHGCFGSAEKRKILQDSLEGRSSCRVIGRRKSLSKNTVSNIITSACCQTRDSLWVASHFKPKWGQVLSFDGKIVRVFNSLAQHYEGSLWERKSLLKRTWLCGIDVKTKDLPHYQLAENENRTDLVTYFKTLKEQIDYDLQVLVCDGQGEIMTSAQIVYGKNLAIQLCVRHFVEDQKKLLKQEKSAKKEETETFLKELQFALNEKEEKACFKRLSVLKQTYQKTPVQKIICQSLDRNFSLLTAHYRFADRFFVPRYNNDAENLFRQLSLRLKSWNMFRNKTNAENYLKTWALARRFTKFTDCKFGVNKLKNGYAPLELAGINISGIDYLKI